MWDTWFTVGLRSVLWRILSRIVTKPTIWHVRPAKTQISVRACMHVCTYVWLVSHLSVCHVCVSMCVHVCLSVSLCASMPVCLSVCLSGMCVRVCVCVCLCLCVRACVPACLPSVCLSVCLSTCMLLSVCLDFHIQCNNSEVRTKN